MQRFVFDRDFDDELEEEFRAVNRPAEVPLSTAELDALRAEAFSAGHTAGYAEGQAEAEGRLAAALASETAATLAALLPAIGALRDSRAAHHLTLETDLLRLIQVLAAQLIPEIEARYGPKRLAAFCRQALRMAEGQGGLELRIAPAMLDSVTAELGPAVTGSGAPVRVLGDADLAPGTARALWDQGRADYAAPALHDRLLTTLSHLATPAEPDRS